MLETIGSTDVEISSLQMDSRKVKQGDCFIAVKGVTSDGHNFVSKCIEQDATTIVCEVLPQELKSDITYIKVQNSA